MADLHASRLGGAVKSFKLTGELNYTALVYRVGLVGLALYFYLKNAPWQLVLAPLLFIPMIRTRVSESVLIVKGLGVQFENRGRYRFASDYNRFIPSDAIRTVFINEVFEGSRVVYVVQVVLRETNEICLAFRELRPRLPVLREVWTSIKNI